MSNVPQFTIKELLDAGVHFGHKTMRWNPKMAPYIYGEKDGVHIVDLGQTAPLLHRALVTVHEVIRNNGRVLFVGTKKQASDIISEEARRCGQYYVNSRWLGGMLTNWPTVSASIKKLEDIEKNLNDENVTEKLTKKEILELTRKRDKLERSFGGIRQMGGQPDLLFIIDTNKENLAVKEAAKLGIPVIAILDTNSDPDNITYPVPGNDDASRSIRLYSKLVADSVIAGIQDSLAASGVDIGEIEDITQLAREAQEKKDDKFSKAKPKKTVTKKPMGKPKVSRKENVE
ncbi:MAG: 30S ribosomal protein S2 [Sphingobacteriia bacterium]|nr:30S ribosomal protein S2 [Sphingobacteriia bacterium]